MKKKLNFWIINFVLMMVTSFLSNGGIPNGLADGVSLGMGTLKISSQSRIARAGTSNTVAEVTKFRLLNEFLSSK